ncbi:MAG: ATPase [Anaerolineae bacterium]|nr:ATPase [Anaerolineae bacterium]
MSNSQPIVILCLASACKGHDFIHTAKHLGATVLLITEEKRREDGWPVDDVDQMFYMPDLSHKQHVLNAVSYLARSYKLDTIVPLDDYDVEMAATLREHMRLPGLGDSIARFFRDKLAMRVQAARNGIRVPPFTGLFNYDELRRYLADVPPPWVLKPRSEAGAIGIRKLHDAEQVWRTLDELGDKQSHYLLEQFVPGAIYHVDSVVVDGTVQFSIVSKYARPPLSVSHEGGVFSTRTVLRDAPDARALGAMNAQLLPALQLDRGVAHAEYIQADSTGEFFFLEVAARVGGAHIAEVVEFASGVNLWAEWAKLVVTAASHTAYELPEMRDLYAASVICLAQQEKPDLSAYSYPEIVWRLNKPYHAGVILQSADYQRTITLADEIMHRFTADFLTHGNVKEAQRVYSG